MRCAPVILILTCLSATHVYAQSPELGDIRLSPAVRDTMRPVIPLSNDRQVRLPLQLDFALSRRRDVILQFGDPLFRMHPQRLDLYWIGDDGQVEQTINNEFDGNARVKMSDDGFTAVAGGAFLSEIPMGPDRPQRVRLYSAKGDVLHETEVEPRQDVVQLEPVPKGNGIIFATAPADDVLSKQAMFVLQGDEVKPVELDIGIIQKIIAVDPERSFVQGSAGFALIDHDAAKAIWSVPQRIRLIGPHAAALSESGERLYLMTGERIKSDAVYRWTLSVLDSRSGKGVAQTKIDGEFPGTVDHVFLNTTDDGTDVRTGDKIQRVTF